MRRVTLIESVTSQRLGAELARSYFALVDELRTALRIDELPDPPEAAVEAGAASLRFKLPGNVSVLATAVLRAGVPVDNWHRAHRLKLVSIVRGDEVLA